MRFTQEYAGKWVATKKEKIVASDKNLHGLMQKIGKRKDKKGVSIDRIPSGFFAGSTYGIYLH